MSVGININQIRSTQYNSQSSYKAQNNQTRNNFAGSSSDNAKNALTARSLEYQQKQQQRPTSVVDQAISYAQNMKASRKKTQEAALEKKKLQYSYKKISSQIVRSKTSISAKRAASAARREVQRLKRLRNSGEYDEEELQISIEHAKSMERVAKKKASHLAQEEMIERTHNGAFANLEEKEEEVQENQEEQDYEDEELLEENAPQDLDQAEYAQGWEILAKEVTEDMILQMEEMTREQEQALRESSEEMSADMMGMMRDAMEEMTENFDLTELADTMVAPNPNMSEDDLKMLKIKHRTKEMKEIAEADANYLKAIFDKYEKDAGKAAANAQAAAPSSPVAAGGSSHTPTPITISIPGGYGAEGGGMSFEAFA